LRKHGQDGRIHRKWHSPSVIYSAADCANLRDSRNPRLKARYALDIISGLQERGMRNMRLVPLLALVMLSSAVAQTSLDPTLQAQLRRVFPNATSFSTQQPGPPPTFLAHTGN